MTSVEHRVLASRVSPRVSIASFFATKVYGPIKELLSEGKEYTDYVRAKGHDGTSALLHFKL